MNTLIVKLKFIAPVHFGTGRLSSGASTCAADTLFSALFIEALAMGCADDLLAAVKTGELLISDAFPWIDAKYYLPKPYIVVEKSADSQVEATASKSENSGNNEQAQSQIKKAMKKLKYIPTDILTSYLAGNIDPFHENDSFLLGTPSLTTKVNLTYEDGEDAEPYHVGGFTFEDNAGLYFIVRTSSQTPFDLQTLLQSLQYSGLGGKRSSGYGRFEYEILPSEKISDLLNKKGSAKILLSSATPNKSELSSELLQGAQYQLSRKSGFIQSSTYSQTQQKKCDLYTFAAGSVFRQTFSGDVFDVSMPAATALESLPTGEASVGADIIRPLSQGNTRTHSVYRYAKAMWLEVQ
jgi:CRISPR-associated protein Csm4